MWRDFDVGMQLIWLWRGEAKAIEETFCFVGEHRGEKEETALQTRSGDIVRITNLSKYTKGKFNLDGELLCKYCPGGCRFVYLSRGVRFIGRTRWIFLWG
jgi:hypothetical protein